LNILDWIDLISLLINCLIKAQLNQQAIYYSKNLIAYIKKAEQSKLMSKKMAGIFVVSLEGIFCENKENLVLKAKKLRLPEMVLSSFWLFMDGMGRDGGCSTGNGFMGDREMNHGVVKDLVFGKEMEVLKRVKEYEKMVRKF